MSLSPFNIELINAIFIVSHKFCIEVYNDQNKNNLNIIDSFKDEYSVGKYKIALEGLISVINKNCQTIDIAS